MTQRVEISETQRITYTQAWDVDNRMVTITSTLGYTATYAYDADGTRVKRVDTSGTLLIAGAHFEVQASTGISTSYYFFGSQRVAMRQNNVVYWLHGDHLGSASLTTNITGAVVSEMRYYPFGETRWVSGTLPTDRLFTGQRVEAGVGLYDYNARMYSPSLGRFISADSIVPKPGSPQELNRYGYVTNNPLKHTDSTGHYTDEEIMNIFNVDTYEQVLAMFGKGGTLEGRWGFLHVLHLAKNGDQLSLYQDGFTDGKPFYHTNMAYSDGEMVTQGHNGCFISALPPDIMSAVNRADSYVFAAQGYTRVFGGRMDHISPRPDEAKVIASFLAFTIDASVFLLAPGSPAPGRGGMEALKALGQGAKWANGQYTVWGASEAWEKVWSINKNQLSSNYIDYLAAIARTFAIRFPLFATAVDLADAFNALTSGQP